MSRLLGRGKKSKGAKNAAPTPGEAINKLRGVEEMLAKKQGYLEAKITEQENQTFTETTAARYMK